MKLFITKAFIMLILFTPLSHAQQCAPWQQWQTFKTHFMSDDGRIIDLGSEQNITTSEGQSYALFFALIANDKTAFDKVLNWTEEHLAEGDLSTRLPAWLWGVNKNNVGNILDSNPASDSDLWIAYSLSQAAILWDDRRYRILAAVLAQRIMREETAYIKGLGLSLLPAPSGFEFDNKRYKLNPSYSPLFIYQQFSKLYPHSPWQELHDGSANLILETSKQGVSPDWIMFDTNKGFYFDKKVTDLGSYNAIRVYLWASMMAEDAPYKKQLVAQFAPFIKTINKRGYVPLNTYAQTGNSDKRGPVGFNAALLPLLATANNDNDAVTMSIQQKLMVDKSFSKSRYYDSVLNLFGSSTLDKRFAILADGTLQPNWSDECR
ncbi:MULTISPECIES: cellulose synthase complex periplasmic endoglucanase BcsZ [Pseudoalteromonas]|uniref:cellulose synthase complex periplasmic endoglucanase BcsZ n=1 Tax=Pseudoalteromonas TaxID=53246 RepID=UPI0018CF77BC|nr:cellulose synthase complex periplasmic endoglucanase BcsZ [Pseudoalteromonas sp. NZS127]MBH0071419.1 cellulase [Pseudoalteromonas sp. NZS127]|tara:strand:- start:21241 stop:22371 length:1131 start_codon:yes stop_codon:yes gene_type:complete